MKGLKVLVLTAAVAVTVPLFGAYEGYLKINGIKGESQDSKHPEWIEVMSFSWGVSNRAAATRATAPSCASNQATFTAKGSPAPQLVKAVTMHPQLDGVVIDFNGQSHALQNAMLSSCQTMGDGSVRCSLNFTRCTTHGGGVNNASVLGGGVRVAVGDVNGDNNAQLIVGRTSKPFHLVGLHFSGNQGTIILQGNGDGGFFQQAFQSKQKSGKVSVKTEYMTFTFTEVLVSSYSRGADGNTTLTLNFAKADGPPAGFQQ